MSLFYTETPSGERRRWTLKEFVQGRPIGHPSHVMFVHFPVALYIGALGLDIVSRIGHFPSAPLAATWLILGAFAGIFVVNEVVRWSHRNDPRAHSLWIVLGAIGVITLTLGQYFGGVLVYRIGFRVYGDRPTKPAKAPPVGEEDR